MDERQIWLEDNDDECLLCVLILVGLTITGLTTGHEIASFQTLYDDELEVEKVHDNDEFDEVQLEEHELEAIEQHEHDEHKVDIEVEVMLLLINATDETEAEHTDTVDEDDGDEVTEMYEMVVEMMIKVQDEEVDMSYQLLQTLY